MTSTNAREVPDEALVLGTAIANLRPLLDLTHAELHKIIGRDRKTIARSGIEPASPSGQLATLLIRVYRSAHVLMGDDNGVIHWLNTRNKAFGRQPKELLFTTQGLVSVVSYLDAHRGKV
ncbi:MbcA/ParS/Xre antitoxin family protein [Litorivicinus lipolyticus]|uniref:MbcA/ParS/Xre antitoxin family protein n=1 Tax=Litorivicinus lipolyticus TaxID=418701 RepID=UPI003B5A13A4